VCGDQITLMGKFGHRIGDGVVEATIERPKLVDLDVRIELESEVGDRLAQVAVVVNDLVHGEAVQQQLPAMEGRGIANLPRLPASGRT